MRYKSIVFAIFFFQIVSMYAQEHKPPVDVKQHEHSEIEVFFSPKGGCTQEIINEINGAQSIILVQAYSFTSPSIAQALNNAEIRGVNVKVILDRSNAVDKYSAMNSLNPKSVILIDSKHAIAHNKIMVIDNKTVITGSFNFTRSAEDRNSENLLVIKNQDLAKKYIENWELHAIHSQDNQKKIP